MWTFGRFSGAASEAEADKTACVLFPLTPALSLRERESAGTVLDNSDVAVAVPLLCLSFRRHTTTKLGRVTKARANVSPSPGGEGWGEGEQDTRNPGRLRFGLGA